MKISKKKRVNKYGTDFGKRGIYDIRNPLNELTGKEWTHFLNSVHVTDFSQKELKLWKYLQDSVIATKFSANGKESYGHDLRGIHPSPKPPQLMRDLILFFTKGGEWVLDPFAGVGGTLLGCSLARPRRHGVGIDLSKRYIDIYKKVCNREKIKPCIAVKGDSRDLDKFEEVTKRKFDLILTDPPYSMMLSKKRTGGDRTKDTSPTPFTKSKKDIGNLDYDKFKEELRKIIANAVNYLENKRYFLIFSKDLQPTKAHHNMLHADIVSELTKIPGLQFKGYKIWYDKTINLYPYGYPFSFVANQLHQFILIFRKET